MTKATTADLLFEPVLSRRMIALSATTGLEVTAPPLPSRREGHGDVEPKAARTGRKKPARRSSKKAKASARDEYSPVAREQERHSPTVPHMVSAGVRVDPATGRPERTEVAQARRRVDDAELAIGMTPEQTEACEGIRRGWQAVVGAVSIRGATYGERIGATFRGGDGGADFDITTHYRAWARSVRGEVLRVVVAVVCEGYTLRAAASQFRDARRDHKWAKRRLLAGLDAWATSAPRRKRGDRPAFDADALA